MAFVAVCLTANIIRPISVSTPRMKSRIYFRFVLMAISCFEKYKINISEIRDVVFNFTAIGVLIKIWRMIAISSNIFHKSHGATDNRREYSPSKCFICR